MFKDEIDTLYIASNKLTQAATPIEQLEAISDYARSSGASWGVLLYLEDGSLSEEVVAEWTVGQVLPLGIGSRYDVYVEGQAGYQEQEATPPTLISDMLNDSRTHTSTLEIAHKHKMRAVVVMPLYNKGRWVAEVLFIWAAPTMFDERDQRVYTALQQQATPVIDSVRLFEQTQKRASELEVAQREMDILYTALRRLTRATTRKELLDGISDYPREKGAHNGQLFYFTQRQLDHVETVATWGLDPSHETPIGFIIDLMQRPFTRYWFSRPEFPTLVSDVTTNDLVDPVSREIFTSLGTRAIAVLPLHTNGRWVGVITFYWHDVYHFDERDRRILTGLQQQLAPAIESVRQFEHSQQRATELEIAKREMDILYSASRQLVRAATPAEQLEAVSDYARRTGAEAGALSYFPESIMEEEVVAEWTSPNMTPVGIGRRFQPAPDEAGPLYLNKPEQPTLIGNVNEDPRIQPDVLALMIEHKVQAIAFLPLHNKGRWIGLLVFRWREPRVFEERDYRVYSALQQQIAPVVDSVRLFEQAQKRATELEIAKHEMDLLYDASRFLMRASTPASLLEAVSGYPREQHAVAAYLLYFDQKQPQWVEVVAEWSIAPIHRRPVGWRLNLTDLSFPRFWLKRPEQVTLIPDLMTSPYMDEDSRTTFTNQKVRSLALLPLYTNGRWIGYVIFCWDAPSNFDDRAERILNALHQQLAPVIDSMRLFEQSTQRAVWAEQLGRVNAALSQATDEQEVLAAVAEPVEQLGVAWAALGYPVIGDEQEIRKIKYVALRNGEGKVLPVETLPHTLQPHKFPHLQLAFDHPDQPVFVENMMTDPREPFMAMRAKSTPWPAMVVLPLKSGDQWAGILIFCWDKPQIFNTDMYELFEAIMPSAASVVAIRRAYIAEQEAREERELLYSASQGINGAGTFGEIVEALEALHLTSLDIVLTAWENYRRNQAAYIELIAGSTANRPRIGTRLTVEDVSTAYTMKQDSTLVIENISTIAESDPSTTERMMEQGYLAFMWVPLVLGTRFMGLLAFESKSARHFTPRERRLAAGIGGLVTAAVERIRLKQESDAARQRAETLAQQAQKLAALEERTRLARELHDSVSQALYGIGLGARTARALLKMDPARLSEPLDYILSLAEAGMTEMRALIFELRPESLEQEGIITALNKQATSMQARYSIQVATRFCEEPALPLEIKDGIFRIAREALHNAVKHAQATQVQLTLIEVEVGYQLEVIDNGVGFDPGQSFPGHLGLQSMRERTASLNGVFEMHSSPGRGTSISVVIMPRKELPAE